MRRAPVTVLLVTALWIVGAATGSLFDGPPHRLRAVVGTGVAAVDAGRWWTVLTSVPWCAQLPGYLATTVAIVAILPVAERVLGSLRTAAAMLALQLAGVWAGIAAVGALGGDSRWTRLLDHTVMLGPTAAVTGVVLLAGAGLGPLWRRRLRLLLLGGLAMMALYSGMLGDVLRLLVGGLGLVLGMVTLGRRRDPRPRPSSRSETRVLVALLVAVSAIGPLVAALAQTRIGPLSVLRFVFTSPPADPGTVAQVCGDPSAAEECLALRTRLHLSGWGSAVMSVMPVLLLLVAATGLRRGRRAAWAAALVLNAALGVLGLVLAAHTASRVVDQRILLGSGVHVHVWLVLALPALQPLAVAAVLVLTRRRFAEQAPGGTLGAATRTVGFGLAGVALVYVVGGLVARQGFTPAPSLRHLLADLPTRFLPPVYLGEFAPAFLPSALPARLLFDWSGPVFWAVVCVAALHVFGCAETGSAEPERVRLRALVAKGGSTLAYLTTWRGNSVWFTPDGSAAVAYRVIGGVAVTVGGPVGDPSAAPAAIDGFVAHCRERGWTPCLYSVDAEVLTPLLADGWSSVQIAEETVLPLAELSFTGRRWQDVRTALNKARRTGTTAQWTTYPDAPLGVRDQIRAISEEWSADKGLPEMGFTLGGLAELDDPHVRLLLAVDPDGTVQAVTSWLPVRRDGAVVGWTLDFMRRRTVGPSGIMEFLIATAAQDVQAEGGLFLSLSGAPLARTDEAAPVVGVARLLDIIARRLEPVYGFRSLLAFKAKFQPSYRPLYLGYPDPVALPAIGTALTRAYLPDLTPRELTRLVRAVL
jgi:lysylphosphatidylglycerol synthetase-like protein (DUF2156 family)